MHIINGHSKQGHEFNLVRDAKVHDLQVVQLQGQPNSKKRFEVNIKFADFEHTFKPGHTISQSASVMDPESLRHLLEGGTFMVVDGKVIEYRSSHYNGFVQDEQQIRKLMSLLGTSATSDVTVSPRLSARQRTAEIYSPLTLGAVWSDEGFEVPTYAEGGQFQSRLTYNWSVFSSNVNASMQLVRLVCTNGMIGWGEWFKNKIPLINRWDEHLDMASRQIQRTIETRAVARITEMGQQRASLAEMNLIHRHASDRLGAIIEGKVEATADERRMLTNLSRLADTSLFTSNVYQEHVFDDSSVAQLLPAHVSAFDAWNMVTEMMSHTPECQDSSNFALTRMANKMMFDEDHRKLSVLPSEQKLASFSDARTAFFGALDH